MYNFCCTLSACPTRPEGAEARSPGQRPGYHRISPCALKGQKLYKAPCFAHFLDKISDALKPPLYFFSKLFSRFSCLFQINNVPLLSKINNFEMEIIYSVKDMGGI